MAELEPQPEPVYPSEEKNGGGGRGVPSPVVQARLQTSGPVSTFTPNSASNANTLNNDLVNAIKKLDAPLVKELLDKGANANHIVDNGLSILAFACNYSHNVKIIEHLLDAGADINWKVMLTNKQQYAFPFISGRFHYLEYCKYATVLLSTIINTMSDIGLNIHDRSDTRTAELVKLLAKRGYNLNEKIEVINRANSVVNSAGILHLVVFQFSPVTARTLLELGVDPLTDDEASDVLNIINYERKLPYLTPPFTKDGIVDLIGGLIFSSGKYASTSFDKDAKENAEFVLQFAKNGKELSKLAEQKYSSLSTSASPLPPKRVLPKVVPKGFKTIRSANGKNVLVPLNASVNRLPPPKRVLPPAASTRKRRRSGRKGSRRSNRY